MCNLLSRIFCLAIFSIKDRGEDKFFPLLYIGGDSWSRNSMCCLQGNESHISSVKSKLCQVNTCHPTLVGKPSADWFDILFVALSLHIEGSRILAVSFKFYLPWL